jgi:LicD family
MAVYDTEKQTIILQKKRLNQSVLWFLIFPLRFIYKLLPKTTRLFRLGVLGKVILGAIAIYTFFGTSLYFRLAESEYGPIARHCARFDDLTSQNFDHTCATYSLLGEIKNSKPGVRLSFQWRDWLDLSVAYDWQNVKIAPFSDVRDLSKYSRPLSKGSEIQHALVGKVYLDNLAEIPDSVIFLGKSGARCSLMSLRNRNYSGFFGDSRSIGGLTELRIEEKPQPGEKERGSNNQNDMRSTLGYFGFQDIFPFLRGFTRDLPQKNGIFTNLTMDDFILNLEELETIEDDATEEQRRHSEYIRTAKPLVITSPKHFFEVTLENNPMAGVHYDWRFFTSVRHEKEHKRIMHHMMRAWSQFAEQEHLLYWISHGSLLGWYWNGVSMPWDYDNDIQMPVRDFDRFSRRYNGTLIVEDEKEGFGRYLIDVNPWYIQRTRGNANNMIDARFIDIRSGIFLDITALASYRHDYKLGCKNYHAYSLEQLSPLRKSVYEGSSVYVPHDYLSTLYEEYPQYNNTEYENWIFDGDLRMWVEKDVCENFKQLTLKFDSNNVLTMYGACNQKYIFNDYQSLKEVTSVHSQEMEVYSQYGMIELGKEEVQTEIVKKLDGLLDKYYSPQLVDPAFG